MIFKIFLQKHSLEIGRCFSSLFGVDAKKICVPDILKSKNKTRISMITCYDYTFSRLIDQTSVDIVLVGDSLSSVIQGRKSTVHVTIEEMAYHVSCVSRGLTRPLLMADMSFLSYISLDRASKNAMILMQAGAEALKLEGHNKYVCTIIEALVSQGVPICGHIGLEPQSINKIGRYKKIKKPDLLEGAKNLENAGCFCCILELVDNNLASEITSKISIPTISIGSGNETDGNVLVLQDMLKMSSFSPTFLKHYSNIGEEVIRAVNTYVDDVRKGISEPIKG